MSRSYYTDDCDTWSLIRWCGAVASSIRGKRGQKFLKDALAALEAMPKKELIAEELETEEGEVCALGACGKAQGHNMLEIDPYDYKRLAQLFDVAEPLIREIEYENDECTSDDPAERWKQMRDLIASLIIQSPEVGE